MFAPIILAKILLFFIRIFLTTIILLCIISKLNLFILIFNSSLLITGIFLLVTMNLSSLVFYRYPLTTTIRINLSLSITIWLGRVLILLVKVSFISRLLPMNTPTYLITFLRLVELVSTLVRPITLSFRLLANITAGHILLGLVCKLNTLLWFSGLFFYLY